MDDPPHLYTLIGGTELVLELTDVQGPVSVKVGSTPLTQPGDAAVLGTTGGMMDCTSIPSFGWSSRAGHSAKGPYHSD